MKRIIYIALILFLAPGTFSCSLDIPQREQLNNEQVSTPQDVNGLALGIYAKARSLFMGEKMMWFDYTSDLLNETSNSGNRGGFFYRWTLSSNDGDVAAIWTDTYAAISIANLLLSKVDVIMEAYKGDAAALGYYKGEAYLWRAILHRQLALRFCQDYEPSTAGTVMGVPIVDEYDLEATPSRGTLANTYTQILADIEEAEQLISRAGAANSTRFTVDCITAFKAQVYLDMHRYDDAIAEVNSLIPDYPLAASAEEVANIWQKDNSSETILQLALTTSELNADYYYYDYVGGAFDEGEYISVGAYIPEQWVVDLYDQANDWRFGTYIDNMLIDFPAGDGVVDAYLISKYLGSEDLRTSTNFNWYSRAKLFRMADLMLIKAEAEYFGETGDPLATLNTLRAARGLAALPDTITDDDLFVEIQNERTREMLCEGSRTPDIKRWKISPTRDTQTGMDNNLAAGAGSHSLTISHNANRILLPIPLSEFSVNSNLTGQQNPGYN